MASPTQATALLALLAMVATVSACQFSFFPQQIRTPTGIRETFFQLTSPDIKSVYAEDDVSGRNTFSYEFRGRILKTINPRLCRWQGIRNENPDLWFDDQRPDRFPMNAENNMPSVLCLDADGKEGAPISDYPMFSRGGLLAPPGTGGTRPLCGDIFNFKAGQFMKLSGVIDAGVIKVLECQSGEEADADDYVMIPLFQADCTRKPAEPQFGKLDNSKDRATDALPGNGAASSSQQQQQQQAAQKTNTPTGPPQQLVRLQNVNTR